MLFGNRICDAVNNFVTCENYDGGDCRPPNITDWPKCPHNPALIGDGTCDSHLGKAECNFDGFDCCAGPELIGNGQCDSHLVKAECNFDGFDCCDKPELVGNGQCNNDLSWAV